MDLRDLKAADWRQGDALPPELSAQLVYEFLGMELSDSQVVVLVSQDCDLQSTSLDKEPKAEAVLGTLRSDLSRGPDNSPRRTVLPIRDSRSGKATERLVLFEDKHRFRFPRERLLGHRRHPAIRLASKPVLEELLHMIVRRYQRIAYPDAFNLRLKPVFNRGKQGYNLLCDQHRLFDEILLDSPDLEEEFKDGQTYRIAAMVVILSEATASDPDRRRKAEDVMAEIETLIRKQCIGIDIGASGKPSRILLRAAEEISLAEYQSLTPWEWDWLSRPDDEADDNSLQEVEIDI